MESVFGPTRNFCFFPTSTLFQTPKRRLEVPNPDAEVLLEIWSSDVTGDELMSSVPGIYKIGFQWFQNWLVATHINVIFIPDPWGFMIQFDEHIFQMG